MIFDLSNCSPLQLFQMYIKGRYNHRLHVTLAISNVAGMKFLVAIALLALAVAEANHVPVHSLRGPRFQEGYTYEYDMVLNVTAGVLGMSSQVSASVIRADVKVRATSPTEHVLKIFNVRFSKSVAAIDNKHGDIPLETDSGLEDRLSSPINFIMENGKITSYTLSPNDNLETKKIKRSVLRSLEMYVPENIIEEMGNPRYADEPIMYNATENTDYGVRIYNYIITTSPYVEFPKETAVYNISRFDNFEGEWYPGYKLHHNFQKQGCPEVCRQSGEWKDNHYGAGCPSGFEPHHSPIKMSFSHQCSLSPVANTLSPDVINTVEVHYAKMYDQDMEVLIRYQLQRKAYNSEEITNDLTVENGQETFNDLHKKDMELNDEEIDELCSEKSQKPVESARTLLMEIAELIKEGKPNSPVGEKIILFRDVLSTFTVRDFKEFSDEDFIPTLQMVQHKEDKESIKRQVWLEVLPLVGTPESVKFMVEYIARELKEGEKHMIFWEAKEMLESLPQNIERPDENTITEIEKLMRNDRFKRNPLLHSAIHVTLGRIIGQICGNMPLLRTNEAEKRSWLRGFQAVSEERKGLPVCPEEKVRKVIQEISQNMKNTDKPEEIAVYAEALTQTGMQEALWEIVHYAHGTAMNLQRFTPRHQSFLRTTVLHTLHNIVGRYPEGVMEIVLPIYFNETETPKIRNAAFGILIRCQPSLAILERVAARSWFEKSREVGSFVTSTLETFGNSTQPCMQLLSHRIREILPQVKRFNIGLHHAKNHMWSYFDALRLFGLEGRLEYTPNNESFVPSTLYHSLSYTLDSLKDTIYQNAFNIEGLTQEKIFDKLLNYVAVPKVEPISHEKSTFGRDDEGLNFLKPREVEDLRLVSYHKLFYKTSYYYLDGHMYKSIRDEFYNYFDKYLEKTSKLYNGYLVKVFLPSSYHTIAMGQTLPHPVEFQMRKPIVFSVGIKTGDTMREKPSLKNFHLHLTPSLHVAKVYTHQMKNLRDCKEVGVYHTHKIGISYPFEIKYDAKSFPEIIFKYKVPVQKNQNVLYYFTESGTYAGKEDFKGLPMENGLRVPILTQPTPFKFTKDISLVGLPPFRVQVFTEDINLFHERLPRTPVEALHMVVTRILNAGWRYKSANITILDDRVLWTGDTEATFKIYYGRDHVDLQTSRSPHQKQEWNRQSRSSNWQQSPDDYSNSQRWQQNSRESEGDDWTTEMPQRKQWEKSEWGADSQWNSDSPKRRQMSWTSGKVEPSDVNWRRYMDTTKQETVVEFAENAATAAKILTSRYPHILHTLNISISTESLHRTAFVLSEYTHTYDKTLHLLKVRASSHQGRDEKPYEINFDHIMGYWERPDELHYDSHFGTQRAYFRTAMDWPKRSGENTAAFEKVGIAAHGVLSYESNKEILQQELWKRVDDKYFMPETHEECLRDVRKGKPLSNNCIKAIREHSAFNKMQMFVIWQEALPARVHQIARVADSYLKHYFFEHMHLTAPESPMENVIDIEMRYIDKIVDEPVADWKIKTPSEVINLERVPVRHTQPFSSVYTVQESLLFKMTNNTYPARCMLTDNYVHTYDLVSYPFKAREDCFYVLSTHCTKKKNFAILLHGKEIHMHVASTRLILLPESNGYKIKDIDGETVEIDEPHTFNTRSEIYAYIEEYESDKHLRVVAKKAGISVLYDGKMVKIQVSPRYKGELCGLCSEFDGEALREFRGIDECLYRNHEDFADSNMVRRTDSCQPMIREPRICEGEMDTEVEHTHPRAGNVPRVQRNIVMYRGDEVCFSVRPVLSCEENVEPSDTESKRIGFHCLPKDDLTARKMITEAKWRPLNELRRKSVDQVETVEVPKMC